MPIDHLNPPTGQIADNVVGFARALRAVETRWIADGFPGAVPDALLDQAVADAMNPDAASAEMNSKAASGDRGRA